MIKMSCKKCKRITKHKKCGVDEFFTKNIGCKFIKIVCIVCKSNVYVSEGYIREYLEKKQ